MRLFRKPAVLAMIAVTAAALPAASDAQKPVEDFSWVLAEGKPAGMRSIPAMSMAPNLLIGDRVAIVMSNREMRRGDVLIFRHPHAIPEKVMVKRLVGLPGDTVQMKGGRLYLNDKPVGRTHVRDVTYLVPDIRRFVLHAIEYSEQLLGEAQPHLIHEFSDSDSLDETPRFTVPEGHLFFMGDSRDNSEDSRAPSGHRKLAMQYPEYWPLRGVSLASDPRDDAIGFVPVKNVMGRAVTVIWTLNECPAREAATVGAECLKPRINKRL